MAKHYFSWFLGHTIQERSKEKLIWEVPTRFVNGQLVQCSLSNMFRPMEFSSIIHRAKELYLRIAVSKARIKHYARNAQQNVCGNLYYNHLHDNIFEFLKLYDSLFSDSVIKF